MDTQISAFHLTAAVNRLRQLRSPVNTPFLKLLAELILLRRQDLYSKAIGQIWLSLARLGYDNQEFFTQLAQDSMKINFVETFSPVDLSNVIYGVGLLQKLKEQRLGIRLKPIGRGPRSAENPNFPLQYDLLETLVMKTILSNHPARLNEVQMVSIVYGLGLAKYNNLESLHGLLEEAAGKERLLLYSSSELSNLLYGMVLLSLNKTQPVLQSVVMEITKPQRLKRATEQDLTCLMYCLRLQNWTDPAILDPIQQELIQPYCLRNLSERGLSMITSNLRVLGIKDSSIFGPLLQEISSNRILSQITNQGLAMALYNYASSEYQDEKVLDKLVHTAMKPIMVSKFTPNDISNIMFALSAVKYPKKEILEPLKKRLNDPTLVSHFQPGHVANVFYGGGKLGFSEELPAALDSILKSNKLTSLGPSQLMQIIHGMGQLGLQETHSLEKILDQLLPQIHILKVNQLSDLIFSLGKMKYRNEEVLAEIMKEIIKPEKIQNFSEVGLCTTLHGLASSEFRQGPLLGGLFQEIILPSRLKAFEFSQLSLVMYSIGKLGVEDSRVLKPLLTEILQSERIKDMSTQGLTNILYGLSQLEQYDEEIWDRFTIEVSKPERIQSFKALELSLIFYAYGMKKLRKPILNKLIQEAQKERNIKEFTTVGLASSLYSFAQLEIQPIECIEKMVVEFCQPHHLLNVTPHHLGNVVFALGMLNYRNKEIMKTLKSEIIKTERLNGFSRHALHNLILGCAQLGYKSNTMLTSLWKEMVKVERLVGFTEREWATIAYSLDTLQFKQEDEVLAIRGKILSSRGLEPISVASRTELKPEDIRKIRNNAENQIENPQKTYSLLQFEKNNAVIGGYGENSEISSQPIGPALHPVESSSRRRKSQQNQKAKRQVLVFNQISKEISEEETSRKEWRGKEHRTIAPWSSPHYNLEFTNWPTGKTSSRAVEVDFQQKKSSSDEEVSFELKEQDPLSAVRHLAEPRPPRSNPGVTMKELMKSRGEEVAKKDNEAIGILVDGLTHMVEKISKRE